MIESVENFKKKLAEIKEISTLSHVMIKIMEIITDENSSAVDLAAEIAKDASLTAKILKMVNSAYYGFYREISKVSDAVVVLGFNEIRRLSLAISVLDRFGGKAGVQRVAFWNHSFSCAAMSDILAGEWRLQDQSAFTAGLLHDIGKMILDQYFPDMFSAIQEREQERSLTASEAEISLYGFDHAVIGYWLSERWNLPINLGEAIRCHHRPEEATEMPELARLVHVADKLSIELVKAGSDEPREEGALDKGENDGMTSEKRMELLGRLEERVKDSTIMDFLT
jgi:putative nucleotidyltransferase with HDIG domain